MLQTFEVITGVSAAPPPELPLRYWIMVEGGLMKLEEAIAAWTIERASTGVKFDPLG